MAMFNKSELIPDVLGGKINFPNRQWNFSKFSKKRAITVLQISLVAAAKEFSIGIHSRLPSASGYFFKLPFSPYWQSGSFPRPLLKNHSIFDR